MIVFIVALSVAIFAGYRLYSIFAEYKAGVDEYSQIADTVVKERDADAEKVQKLKDAKGKIVKHWTAPLEVDFDELESINKDVAGCHGMTTLILGENFKFVGDTYSIPLSSWVNSNGEMFESDGTNSNLPSNVADVYKKM